MKARSGQNYPPCFAHVISNENEFAIIFVVFISEIIIFTARITYTRTN